MTKAVHVPPSLLRRSRQFAVVGAREAFASDDNQRSSVVECRLEIHEPENDQRRLQGRRWIETHAVVRAPPATPPSRGCCGHDNEVREHDKRDWSNRRTSAAVTRDRRLCL